MFNKLNLSADVIVVGTGPGGATVARELSKNGKKVLLLERGYDHREKFYYGSYLGALRYSDRASLLFTEEGLNIIAPIMVGGATSMYAGCAAEPPAWLNQKYGIDTTEVVNEVMAELGIQPLPEHLRGEASTRIAQAARALGYDWFAQPKFMNPERCRDKDKKFECQASCMLGCRCGAKWNAAEWVDEAVAKGARLRKGMRVHKVLFEDNHAVGVQGSMQGMKFKAKATTVILAAGGIGSPIILQNSGLNAAGVGMTMDTTVMIYGAGREKGTAKEPPMTWSWENPDAGYMLSTLTDPWLLYPLAAIRKGIGPALRWLQWNKMLGVMIKLKDDISGGIYPDGTIRKPLTAADNDRLADAYAVCRKILIEAGAKESSIFMRPFIGTHPSGTVRIGDMLDTNLQTEVKGLYVCDASVFPEALDRPTVLTIIALAKRLARHLMSK
ncbi:MAG: GMC family oxidoreductase [Deltaproteobacteria bacterium]|jgi:choline dehydrogenase-like flavoprotein|nr:GMC family oxidoreductase [Deltaproteobacteria bacterium]